MTKVVNLIVITALLQRLSVAVNFIGQPGLNVHDVIEIFSKGTAASGPIENRAVTRPENKFGFGFTVDWMRKHLGNCLTEADTKGALFPLTAKFDQFYRKVQDMGGARWNTLLLMRR